ncbi:class I SAM-dependent methyltransferase [Oceanibacterium hippocampi]|uniref:Methyltransferase type 12 domain-containing protein n=1 Tax=Oceanibacterium hippocampi TaxID=745714 RepID=A0A1Y5RAN7_9PROT|nr:class I SAM-dependent methyltransferase [Oceanibacterium hippocampi]SLN12304.1 hypothetical protein OCH7691_00144 [Oceanibacterium hippocampi]
MASAADGPESGDGAVRQQYELYPYPPRDPADEARRLITGSPSQLPELNHYVFAGSRDFRRSFRALVAGGGTGDAAIMLAQQLADAGRAGSVTYLDISAASREIAEARAAARGLTNIRFVEGSLLDLPELGLGRFDYIDCCGVLHHLADPLAGLKALAAVLHENGGMGLMLYGTLGRNGVYPLQEALRSLVGDDPLDARIAAARALLGELPESNWFRKNQALGDHLLGADAALFDLLLHPRDRSYRVPEIFDLCGQAGLAPSGFIEPIRYDPLSYLTDPLLRERAAELAWPERLALAENLAGNLKTHVFYAVRSERAERAAARFDKPLVVPFLREGDPRALARLMAKGGNLKVTFDGAEMRLPIPTGAAEIVALVDGKRSLGELQKLAGLDRATFFERFEPVYNLLNGLNLMLLRR